LSANKTYTFTDLLYIVPMLPESIERKKIKNVCVIFWLPCLPYENGV